jgi:hypothetical protein
MYQTTPARWMLIVCLPALAGCLSVTGGATANESNSNGGSNGDPVNDNQSNASQANDNLGNDNQDNDNSGGSNDNENSNGGVTNENDNGESEPPETLLRVSNFSGLPRETYVDDEFIALVAAGDTTPDYPIEPGSHTFCYYKIGKIDGICDVLEAREGEVFVWLLTPEED